MHRLGILTAGRFAKEWGLGGDKKREPHTQTMLVQPTEFLEGRKRIHDDKGVSEIFLKWQSCWYLKGL